MTTDAPPAAPAPAHATADDTKPAGDKPPAGTSPTPTAAAQPVQPASRWQVEIERDLMGGSSRSYVAQTAAVFNGPANRAPALTLRCGLEGNTLEVLYNPQIYLGRPVRTSESEGVKVRLRFDERSPWESAWVPSTNRNAAFAPGPRDIFEQFLRHRTVAIEVEAHNSRERVAAEFDLTGLAEASEALSTCLPPLPPPEITRDFGIEADRLNFRMIWRVVPRGLEAHLAQQQMLVFHSIIDVESGNQASLRFWCDGTNLVGQMRFPDKIPARVTSLTAHGLTRNQVETIANPRRVDDRTIAIPDPWRVVRHLSSSNGESGRVLFAFVSGQRPPANLAAFEGLRLSPEHLAMLQRCLNSQGPAQSRPARR